MKRYEGLFILNLAGKEEGLNDAVEKVRKEIESAAGKIETVQKMDKKPFARVRDRKHSSGHYVNFIFEAEPAALKQLETRFKQVDEVFRVLFSILPPAKAKA